MSSFRPQHDYPSQFSQASSPTGGPNRVPRMSPEPLPKPKVAIPRLRRESDAALAGGSLKSEKQRVSHACESCRVRKVRCSGGTPVCEHCGEHDLVCIYGDGKRDRAKKELGTLQEKVDNYETLLRRLCLNAEPADQRAIQDAMGKASQQPAASIVSSPAVNKRPWAEDELTGDEVSETGGEHFVSAEVGSVGSLDKVHEGVDRDETIGADPFFGKNAEMAWIYHLKDELVETQVDGGPPETVNSEQKLTSANLRKTGSKSGLSTGPARAPSAHKDPFEGARWTYNLDDHDLELPDQLHKLDLPPRNIADQLVSAYFSTVHLSFPILLQRSFRELYDSCYQPYGQPISDQDRAIVNLVLAIGAKYCVSTYAGICEDRDHLNLFCRARGLSLDNGATWRPADLQQVQVAGLAGLYLIAIGHTNRQVSTNHVLFFPQFRTTDRLLKYRAWYMSGLTIRYAQGLGLHLRTDAKHLTDVDVETRVRVWWSIYSLERLLGVMTGRPSSIHENDVSTPLPHPTEEYSFPANGGKIYKESSEASPSGRDHSGRFAKPSNIPSAPSRLQSKSPSTNLSLRSTPMRSPLSSSNSPKPPKSSKTSKTSETPDPALSTPNTATFFFWRTRMNIIIHHIVGDLYCAATVQSSWAEAQHYISKIELEIGQWLSDLPPQFNFCTQAMDQRFARERMELGILYWSSRIILNRPCLCRLDGMIKEESTRSKDFNRDAARSCVDAARKLIHLIPDEHGPIGFYHLCPWWAILHYLMQAVVVLIIGLKVQVTNMPNGFDDILKDIRKALKLIHSMAEVDLAARRAGESIEMLLQLVEASVGHNVSLATNSSLGKLMPTDPMAHTASFPQVVPERDREAYSGNFMFDPAGTLSSKADDLYHSFMYSMFDNNSLFSADMSSIFPTETEMNMMNNQGADQDLKKPGSPTQHAPP